MAYAKITGNMPIKKEMYATLWDQQPARFLEPKSRSQFMKPLFSFLLVDFLSENALVVGSTFWISFPGFIKQGFRVKIWDF